MAFIIKMQISPQTTQLLRGPCQCLTLSLSLIQPQEENTADKNKTKQGYQVTKKSVN